MDYNIHVINKYVPRKYIVFDFPCFSVNLILILSLSLYRGRAFLFLLAVRSVLIYIYTRVYASTERVLAAALHNAGMGTTVARILYTSGREWTLATFNILYNKIYIYKHIKYCVCTGGWKTIRRRPRRRTESERDGISSRIRVVRGTRRVRERVTNIYIYMYFIRRSE